MYKKKAIESADVYWILSSDVVNKFDSLKAFDKLLELDWGVKMNLKIKIGHKVLGYCKAPFQQIMFEAEVVEVDVPKVSLIDDSCYAKNVDQRKNCKWIRLKIIRMFCEKDTRLSYAAFKDNGLKPKDTMQGARLLNNNPELFDYVISVIDDCTVKTY